MKNTIACLFGGGDIPSFSKECLDGTTVVGVDGGTNFLMEQKIIPDIVVGDLDSISPQTLNEVSKSAKIIKIEEQETTDFEKALYTIKTDIYICFGFWGNDIAHSIEILHILQEYFRKKIIVLSEKDCVFLLPKTGKISVPIGTTFSIYPLTSTKFISSTGLQYPLDNLTLSQGKKIGTRNKTTEEEFTWIIKKGKSIGIISSEQRKSVLDFLQNNARAFWIFSKTTKNSSFKICN